jgi:hypothetical protein
VYLAALVPASAFAQGFARVSVPIPVEIEGQTVRCPLYLKLEMRSFNQPLEKFAAGGLDNPAGMFFTAVEAIRSNDSAKFASVWAAPNQMAGPGAESVALADNSAEGWLKAIRGMFNFDTLTVVAEVQAGDTPIFIWDAKAGTTLQRRAFFVAPDKQGKVKVSIVSSAAPVADLIVNSFEAALGDPENYKPLSNINLRYQYPIPLEGKGAAGAHPVFFEFDGTPMDFPVGNEKIKATTPLLQFLRAVNQASAGADHEAYYGFFTEKSRAKVKQWLAGIVAQAARQRALAASQGTKPPPPMTLASVASGNVKFVMNADPVYLVFRAPTMGANWTSKDLTYLYVLSQGGSYKIANFAFSNFLDDFLQNPTLFDKRTLKPAPPKPGTAPAKRVSAAAAKPAIKH